jgi:lipoate---protein ligase
MDIHDHLYTIISDIDNLIWKIWEPKGTAVIIGYSQKAENEVDLSACKMDSVPIIRRRGGGGAVVLMPGIVCMTIAFKSNLSDSPYFFFKKINELLIDILSTKIGMKDLAYKGISDISIGNKKILGCSIFKSRNVYFYQGSLLINPQLHKINRYLLHPSKEPDYRNKRSHSNFLTSLAHENYDIQPKQFIAILEKEFKKNLKNTVINQKIFD